ncbi:hypothetical protein FB451DRAFT_1225512 [Mycena latifolia]|nr:hypothetical protein FB451DRAFT_1225512 [Mycena latifolia]
MSDPTQAVGNPFISPVGGAATHATGVAPATGLHGTGAHATGLTSQTTVSGNSDSAPTALSKGEISGIVVGVLVLISMLGITMTCLWRRRRKPPALGIIEKSPIVLPLPKSMSTQTTSITAPIQGQSSRTPIPRSTLTVPQRHIIPQRPWYTPAQIAIIMRHRTRALSPILHTVPMLLGRRHPNPCHQIKILIPVQIPRLVLLVLSQPPAHPAPSSTKDSEPDYYGGGKYALSWEVPAPPPRESFRPSPSLPQPHAELREVDAGPVGPILYPNTLPPSYDAQWRQ